MMMGICIEKGNPGLNISITMMVIPVNVQSKTTESVRLERIAYIEEAIKDTDKQIKYKNLRKEQAGNSHQYQLCENITE